MLSAIKTAESFKRVFGSEPERITFAPGRVNLIGEHTDYNGGHVLPCALDAGTLCAARARTDGRLRFYSLNMPGELVEASLNEVAPLGTKGWTAYPMGVIGAFRDAGYQIPHGADFLFLGDVPAGAGLSSSAAMEVATGLMLSLLYGFEVSGPELARLCQKAENRYVGMNCGIMDQFASAMGRAGCALYLDTNSLEYEYAPLELGSAELIIVNSNVKHSLAGSAYNDRRQSCERALALLKEATGKTALCGISPEAFEENAHLLNDPVLEKRARHAVYEEARTRAAFDALRGGDLAAFGRAMNGSHISLRDDYEVSCRELDILTELAWSTHGVLGARMTGGGFGGCMVCLVGAAHAEEFKSAVSERYLKETGITAEIYDVLPGEGAHTIDYAVRTAKKRSP